MKTRAAILHTINKPLSVEEIDTPALKAGQVLVKILYSGLCGSQLNEIRGGKGPDRFLPHLLGHEGSGIVIDAGRGVRKVKKNDYVVISWLKGTGKEVVSVVYRQGKRRIRSGAVATLCEYAVISENRLVKISKSIPPDVAALLGCAVPTGAGAVLNLVRPKAGESFAVFGAGGVGGAALLAANMQGCRPVIAVDIHAQKLRWTKKLGAMMTCHAGRQDPVRWLRKKVPGGADFVFESSGVGAAMEQAVRSAKDDGCVVLAGNLKEGETIRVDPFDFIKGKRVLGTWGGQTMLDRDIPRLASFWRRGRLPVDKLITHRFPLDEINRAFSVLAKGAAGRILIKMSDE